MCCTVVHEGRGSLLCSVIVLVSQFNYRLWVVLGYWSAVTVLDQITLIFALIQYSKNISTTPSSLIRLFTTHILLDKLCYKVSDDSSSYSETHPWIAAKCFNNIYTYMMMIGFLSVYPWISSQGEYFYSVMLSGCLEKVWVFVADSQNYLSFLCPCSSPYLSAPLYNLHFLPLLLPYFLLYCYLGKVVGSTEASLSLLAP